jgi:hypothetical protein
MDTDERGAFLAPSALFGAAWAARRKASQLLSPMNILLNSKLRIQNLKLICCNLGFASFIPQRFDGVELGGTHGRVEARKDADGKRNAES